MWAWFAGLVVLLVGSVASVWLYRLIQARETEHIGAHLQSVTRAMEIHTRILVDQRVRTMIQGAERLARGADFPREEWRQDARLFMEHEDGSVVVAVTAPDGTIRWLETLEDAGLEEGQRLPLDPGYLASLSNAETSPPLTAADTAVGVHFMPDDQPASILFVPIGRGSARRGFLVGIRRIAGAIDPLFAPFESAGVDVTVQRGGVTVYQSAPGSGLPDAGMRESFSLSFAEPEPAWNFIVSMSQAASANRSYLPATALAMGLGMSLMMALLAVLGLSRYSHGVALNYANRILRDEIGERLNIQQELTFLARHDPLTRLPNRVEFVKQAEAKLAEHDSGRLAVMFLDVDAFKDINDSMGHATGDALLQRIADSLASVLESGDCLGRYGGDEFVIAAERSDQPHVETLAKTILDHFERGFQLNGQRFHVTASVGIALFPDGGKDVETLIRNADAALFQAKREGRHRYALFEPDLMRRVSRRHALSQDINRALAEQEFHVVYQPIVRLDDQSLCGAEALLRWHRGDGEIVGPAEFIPIAEQSGMIGQLSRLALDLVGVDMSEWRRLTGEAPRVSVNISGSRFKQPGFFERLSEMVRRHDLPPDRLQLEITEQVLVEDLPRIRVALDRIAELGVKLAVDDFGVGYSSLAYLKNLPVSTVKIDRGFIRGLANDEHDLAITRAICDLARQLGMQTVAEGIETEEQLRLLTACCCHMGQGYWFSRPVAAACIAEMLSGRETWRGGTLPIRHASES